MNKPKPRRFRVAPGMTVTLPKSTLVGPGATNMMFRGPGVPGRGDDEPTEFEVETVDRFIRGRVRAGDLVEVTDSVEATTRVKETPTTRELAGDIDLDLSDVTQDLPAPAGTTKTRR